MMYIDIYGVYLCFFPVKRDIIRSRICNIGEWCKIVTAERGAQSGKCLQPWKLDLDVCVEASSRMYLDSARQLLFYAGVLLLIYIYIFPSKYILVWPHLTQIGDV